MTLDRWLGDDPLNYDPPPIITAEMIDRWFRSYLGNFAAAPPPVGPDEFRCAQCGKVDKKNPDEAAVLAKYRASGLEQVPADELAVVCDDCYAGILKTAGVSE